MNDDINNMIDDIITQLNSIETVDLPKLQDDITELLTTFGDGTHFQMVDEVNKVFNLIEGAFTFLKGPSIDNFFDQIVEKLTSVIDGYVAHIIEAVDSRVGNTEPLANIYDATYTNVCLEIIAPFNSG